MSCLTTGGWECTADATGMCSLNQGTLGKTGVKRKLPVTHQFLHGRGIVVVQQSPKLPYGSSILSVRAIVRRAPYTRL